MKKTMLFLVAAFATMSVFAQLPKAGDKGYLYDSKSELFVTAEGTLGQTGELFTIKDEGTTHPDKNGTQLPDFRFLTNHQATGDHGEGQTMLSVRNTEKVTTTEDYGYGVFSLYLNDAGTAFRIMNAKNNNRGIHLQFDCLGYEGTTLKFVAEADAPYWTFMSEEDYKVMENYTRKLFARGQMIAQKQGLILVDTKYEFGKRDGKVYLIDEIHTPDSSRYFYADGYEEKLAKGEPQRQLSKEFVRQWLIEHNFMNEPGQTMPEITDEYAESVSERYIELYEHIIGERFEKAADNDNIAARIEQNVSKYLKTR